MRDILLLGFIGVILAFALRYPFAGLLSWAWFTLMTPHQLAYGVFGVPLNTVIAGVTIASFLVWGEFIKFRVGVITIPILLLCFWLTLAQQFSLDPENSAQYYDRLIKTLIFVLLCAMSATTRLRFHALLWVLVASIGFFAIKGALFTIVTFGEYRVQGLPRTVLEDNNHIGIAIATILPLVLYLRNQATHQWMKIGLLMLFVCSIISILGTHSRGAFLAMVGFGGVYWLRSKYKFSILAGLFFLMIPTIAFMPSKWTERMTTITEASEDASFMGRVDAWIINYKLAKQNPFTGAGQRNSYQKEIAATVDIERSKTAKAAHSIYFEMLGGSGFVGLGLYLSIFGIAFLSAWRIYLLGRHDSVEKWKADFCFYAQISLVIFGIGGASASMEMWDGYLIVIALIAAVSQTIDPKLLQQRDKKALDIYGLRQFRVKRKHPV